MPPRVHILAPSNGTSYMGSVSLVFIVDRPVVWMGYSLNNHANLTIHGNTTLAGLAEGTYTIKVYTKDSFGNIGPSEIVHFTVTNPAITNSAKTTLLYALAIILPAVVVIAIAAAIKRYKRRKRVLEQPKHKTNNHFIEKLYPSSFLL